MDKQRDEYLKKGRNIEIFAVSYNFLEVVFSLIGGIASGSAALIGWGLDSIIEGMSGGTLWWRLNGELKGISDERVRKRKQIALYVIAVSFLIVSIFITYDSISKFISQKAPGWSTLGVVILVISLVVNPILVRAKYKVGKKLNSEEMKADAKDTFVCLYQTIVVLGGLLLVRWLDWWWADPVAALLIVPYALKEGWEAYQNGRKIKVEQQYN